MLFGIAMPVHRGNLCQKLGTVLIFWLNNNEIQTILLVSPFLSRVEGRSCVFITKLFSMKTKKYLDRYPADSWLEYIYFMKIGQPKLSERKGQRSGLFVPPTNLALERFWDSTITGGNQELKSNSWELCRSILNDKKQKIYSRYVRFSSSLPSWDLFFSSSYLDNINFDV